MICYNCNSKMSWNSDYSFEDVGIEGEGIVSYFTCSECDSSCEFFTNIKGDVE